MLLRLLGAGQMGGSMDHSGGMLLPLAALYFMIEGYGQKGRANLDQDPWDDQFGCVRRLKVQ